jgi:hypothetical protein
MRRFFGLILSLALAACAARPILDEFVIARSTIRMSNDGARVVAMGKSPNARAIVAVRGCAAGSGWVDYEIFYDGRVISGAVPWHDGDRWSELCGERI